MKEQKMEYVAPVVEITEISGCDILLFSGALDDAKDNTHIDIFGWEPWER